MKNFIFDEYSKFEMITISNNKKCTKKTYYRRNKGTNAAQKSHTDMAL